MRKVWTFAAAFVSLLAMNTPAAAEPVLGVSGDKFTVNGVQKFLIFVSYFDGMRASDAAIEQDFAYLQSRGVDGVRIFANWWQCSQNTSSCSGTRAGDTLMEPTVANLRADRLARLKYVLDRAAAYNLVVDLSFAKETIGPSPLAGSLWQSGTNYGYGIRDTANALASGYRHVMFDFQNEVDHTSGGVYDQRVYYTDASNDGSALSELKYYLNQPWRVVVTSSSENHDTIRRYNYCGHPTNACGPDDSPMSGVAVHDFRGSDWQNQTGNVVNGIRNNVFNTLPAKPIYLQEPMPWQDASGDEIQRVEKFLVAASSAKAAGAAAWTFHTRKSFILSTNSLYNHMGGGERAVLDRLRSRVDTATSITAVHRIQLRTVQNLNYVVAEGGGGGAVNANRPSAAQWETFNLIDLNGGLLMHGDWVNLQSYNWNYVAPTNGGGSTTNAIAAGPGQQQTVQIHKLEGGSTVISPGQWVGFRCNSGVWWMVAESGGGTGSVVNWNRTSPGLWETFQLGVLP